MKAISNLFKFLIDLSVVIRDVLHAEKDLPLSLLLGFELIAEPHPVSLSLEKLLRIKFERPLEILGLLFSPCLCMHHSNFELGNVLCAGHNAERRSVFMAT